MSAQTPPVRPELAARLHRLRAQIQRNVDHTAPPLPELEPYPLERLREKQRQAEYFGGAVGQVNPRPPGVVNRAIQSSKQLLARSLDWQLRPQRDFNRAVAEALTIITETLEQTGRAMQHLRRHLTLQRWAAEGEFMRQADAFQQFREEAGEELQRLRQRLAGQARAQTNPLGESVAVTGAPLTSSALPLDYFELERHFRGTEQEIHRRQSFYLQFFSGRRSVLDIACGRGEFLELMRGSGVPARGIDLDSDMVGRCLEKNLDVMQGDVFAFLDSLPAASLDGIFSSQFVEHLEPGAYMRLISQCAAKLSPGGVLAIETQNPECLAIFSQSFFIDPTHVKPIPPALLRFLFAENGLERITTHFLSPASAVLPLLPRLASQALEPEALAAYNGAVTRFNETFFGGMDYAVIGYRK